VLFRQLGYFVAVARERHFARAVEACLVMARAFVIAAGGLSLDEFFDQTLPAESLVV
jgi:hypothetical protein